MRFFIAIILGLIVHASIAQEKNFLDVPFLETQASADTLVTPDRIYLSITLTEKDSKGKIPVEVLEKKMYDRLKAIGIDVEKQLKLTDIFSNYMNYVLKSQDILKAKIYNLVLYDAETAGKVIVGLENEGISNVRLVKIEYSEIETLKLELRSKAIVKALHNAESLTKPLNQKVGRALFIADYSQNGVYNHSISGNTAGIVIRGTKSMSDESSYSPIEIDFEKIKIEVTINVKFKIE